MTSPAGALYWTHATKRSNPGRSGGPPGLERGAFHERLRHVVILACGFYARRAVIPAQAGTQGPAPRQQQPDARRCTDHLQPELGARAGEGQHRLLPHSLPRSSENEYGIRVRERVRERVDGTRERERGVPAGGSSSARARSFVRGVVARRPTHRGWARAGVHGVVMLAGVKGTPARIFSEQNIHTSDP